MVNSVALTTLWRKTCLVYEEEKQSLSQIILQTRSEKVVKQSTPQGLYQFRSVADYFRNTILSRQKV